MAKGDSTRAQQQINDQGRIAQNSQNSVMNTIYGQNMGFNNAYNASVPMSFNDYGNMMGNYSNFYNNPFGSMSANYGNRGLPYQQTSFIDNGGDFSSRIMNALQSGHPGKGQDFYNSQLQYYLGKNADPNEISAWATGEPGKTMQDYWVQRALGMGAGGADAATAGPYAGGDSFGSGGGGGDYFSNLYNSIFGGFNFGMNPEYAGALSSAIGGFGDFAKTGGFSPQDIQDIRARAVSPIRSIYDHAKNEVNRGKALQGFSPNYNSALSRMAREQSYATGDALTNANAAIAQMVQQGKLAGLGGLVSAGGTGQGLQNSLTGMNANALTSIANMGLNARLNALGGMSGMYGATPGLANMYGNQLLNSSGQLLTGQGLQNQLGLGLIGGQNQKAGIPGNFQQAIGNIGNLAKIGGGIISAF